MVFFFMTFWINSNMFIQRCDLNGLVQLAEKYLITPLTRIDYEITPPILKEFAETSDHDLIKRKHYVFKSSLSHLYGSKETPSSA